MSGRRDDISSGANAETITPRADTSADSAKIIALLDIDATLVSSGDAAFLNQTLLDALKSQGITDLYLFSTMYRSSLSHDLEALAANRDAFTRPNLLAELKRQGFNVHDVYIPADLVTGKLGATYRLYEQQYNRLAHHADYENDGQYQQFINKVHTDDATSGERGIDAGYNRKPYLDTKGLLYEQFVRHLPEIENQIQGKVAGVVYCDDADSCIAAVDRAQKLISATVNATEFPAELVVKNQEEATRARLEGLDNVPLQIIHIPNFTLNTNEAAEEYEQKNKRALQNSIARFTANKPQASLEAGKTAFKIKQEKKDRLDNLVENIKTLSTDYTEKLKRSRHKKDIKILNEDVNKIMQNKSLPNEKKYQKIVMLLEEEFAKEMTRFCQPFLGIGKKRSPADFIKHLNKMADKKDSLEYQYPLLLARELQSAYKFGPSTNPELNTHRNTYRHYIEAIKLPFNPVYTTRIPDLLSKEEQVEFNQWKNDIFTRPRALDIQQENLMKEFDKIPRPLLDAQLFRLFKGQETRLSTEGAKRFWPELKTVPNKAINIWLTTGKLPDSVQIPRDLNGYMRGSLNYQLAQLKVKIAEKNQANLLKY